MEVKEESSLISDPDACLADKSLELEDFPSPEAQSKYLAATTSSRRPKFFNKQAVTSGIRRRRVKYPSAPPPFSRPRTQETSSIYY
jgi:hypothetical protein